MIADSVEIISCHPEEDQARRLTLRSVHGKYLIRLLDKGSGDPKTIGDHGTIFRLRVRPSVELLDVVKTAEQWIVVPECKVTVQVDDKEAQPVGFSSPTEALRGFLKSSELDYHEDSADDSDVSKRRIRIVERQQDDVTVAYALVWDRWFKEWSFLTLQSFWRTDLRRFTSEKERSLPLLGTCVEGIRIVTDTPGFEGYPIVAVVNVRGQSAPKTNVARSGLEVTPERDAMLGIIYKLYAEHVTTELFELASKRSFSPTWATGETAYLLAPLFGGYKSEATPLSPKLFHEALRAIPCVMVEEKGKRVARSPKELLAEKELWTIDCGLLSSAESLIREVASAASLSALVDALNVSEFKFPDAPVVCGANHRTELVSAVFARKEVDQIKVDPKLRRVDLHWVEKTNPPRWIELPAEYRSFAQQFSEGLERGTRGISELPLVPGDGIVATVPSGEIAVRAFGSLYLTPGTAVAAFARRCIEDLTGKPSNEALIVAVSVLGLIGQHLASGRAPVDAESVKKSIRNYDRVADHLQLSARIEDVFDFSAFATLMMGTNWKSFDTSAWRRRGGGMETGF